MYIVDQREYKNPMASYEKENECKFIYIYRFEEWNSVRLNIFGGSIYYFVINCLWLNYDVPIYKYNYIAKWAPLISLGQGCTHGSDVGVIEM